MSEKELANGVHLTFYPNGSRKFQTMYAGGKRHGSWRAWQPNGQLVREQWYCDGEPDGDWQSFYHSGQIKQLMRFKVGHLLYNAEYDERGLKVKEIFSGR